MNIKVGDKVAFTAKYLQRIGEASGDMAIARGVVDAIHSIPSRCLRVAEVTWDMDMPRRVKIANLAIVGSSEGAVSVHKNEGENHKLAVGATCAFCHTDFKPGEEVVHHRWKTAVMPAPAFYIYHIPCFLRRN